MLCKSYLSPVKTPALNNRLPQTRPSRLPSPAIYLARLRTALSQTKALFTPPVIKIKVRNSGEEKTSAE